MLKHKTDYVIDLLVILAVTTNFNSIYQLWIDFEHIPSFGIRYVPFIILMLFLYTVNTIMFRRARYENTVIIANIFLFLFSIVAGLLIVTDYHDITSPLPLFFKCIVFLFFAGYMYNIAAHSLLPGQIMMQFEISLALLALTMLSSKLNHLPYIAASILLIVALILKRTENQGSVNVTGSPVSNILLIFFGGGGIFVVSLLISFLFTGTINSLLHSGVKGFAGLVSTVCSAISRFFLFLLNLLPDADPEAIEMEPQQLPNFAQMAEEPTESNPMVLIILAAAAVIALILLIMFFLYKNRGTQRERGAVIDARLLGIKIPFFEVLKKLWAKIMHRLAVLHFLLTNQNTLQGLFWKMDDFGKRNQLRRKAGESGSRYLERICQIPELFEEHEVAALGALSQAYTMAFYSGETYVADKKMIGECKKIFRKKVHKRGRKKNA